jgi:type IV pilus assembly protein PilX
MQDICKNIAPGKRCASIVGSRQQQGVALVVVLLFLVAITGISVWTARQSMLSEGMARNQMDQEVARQAAESALRDAERDIYNAPLAMLMPNALCQRSASMTDSSGINPSHFTSNCAQGLCLKDDMSYRGARHSWCGQAARVPDRSVSAQARTHELGRDTSDLHRRESQPMVDDV